jgi:mRNA interferase MazF
VRRGDIVTVAISGDFGKPRPALVIQADQFDATGTVTVLLISSTLTDAPLIRPTIQPTAQSGLRKASQVMVDKAMSVKRERTGTMIGRLEDDALLAVTRSLAVFWVSRNYEFMPTSDSCVLRRFSDHEVQVSIVVDLKDRRPEMPSQSVYFFPLVAPVNNPRKAFTGSLKSANSASLLGAISSLVSATSIERPGTHEAGRRS